MKTSIYLLTSLALATYSFGKTIPNHAIADLVLGQPDFVTDSFPGTSAASLSTSTSVVIDPVTRKVFVGDEDGDRVLRYASADALANGASAEAVFGQARFSTEGSNDPNAELGMADPDGLFFDRKGRLWVADQANNRVLMFEAASFRGTQPFPDVVLGQPDFFDTSSGLTISKMNSPRGVWVDASDRLWVADDDNNRILRFDAVSTKDTGGNADGVLGQALFTTNASSNSASGLSSPTGVAISSTGALFVSDQGNNRVVRYNNAAGKAPGANADAVLGQAGFGTTTPGITATTMDFPSGVTITPDDALWVTDADNNRIIRFDAATTILSGAAANGVVGQPNFTTNIFGLTDRGLGNPAFSCFVDARGALWVPDQDNNRVLRFPADETKPLLVVTTTVPKNTKKKKITIDGTASDQFGVALVQFQVGTGPLQPAVGTTTWQIKPALKKGKNVITVFATDTVGNVSVSQVIRIKRK